MSAGDGKSAGVRPCRHRGEAGHLPHPDEAPCIVNSPAPGVYGPEQGRAEKAERGDLGHLLGQVEDARREVLRAADTWARVCRDDADTNARRAEEAEQDAARYKDDHLRACFLVAELYEAGTGRRGAGPQRGVVEDVRDTRLRGAAAEEALEYAHRDVRQLRERVAQLDHAHRAAERLRQQAEGGADPEQVRELQADRNKAREEVRSLRRAMAAQDASMSSAFKLTDEAREQSAECMRETAQLHRQLDSLGTSPEKLAQQVGAGMAVSLFGRVYVQREDDRAQQPTLQVTNEAASPLLLETGRGVFLPIPTGYMLSVSVTPWDDTPLPD